MMQSVQVIIERLKSHPEDFFGDMEGRRTGRHASKFDAIREKLDDLLIEKPDVGHIHRLWYLEPEEKAALLAAYKEARRARFEAKVFHTLLTKPEESQYDINVDLALTPRGTGKMVVPQNMLAAATEILNKEFDKAYAKNRNT